MSSYDHAAPSSATLRPECWVGVVDDDASIRTSLARLIRLEGIPVETFASAEAFLERLAHGAPSCLVLDVHLGGRSGFDLQDELLSRPSAPPIIFITAHEEVPAFRLAEHGGARGYLRKPFDSDALFALLLPFVRPAATDDAGR